MSEPGVEIRLLTEADEMPDAVEVFGRVWSPSTPIVSVELLRAIAHAGGYVAAARRHGDIIGASFGFLGEHRGERVLHSHVTGVVPGAEHAGVGRAIKFHQRAWAAERSIPFITWTFDPLVRRNAWFNICVLGADPAEYLTGFYGQMTDAVNANDASDRLFVVWPTTGPTAERSHAADATTVEVATPDDIVTLRRTDPDEVARWRASVRQQLAPLVNGGGRVVGMTPHGAYLVRQPD